MGTLTVMRTGGGSPPNWSFHRLKDIEGVSLLVCDANPDSVSFFSVADQYEIIPRADHEDFIPAMLEIVRKHKVDIILPAVDEELIKFSAHQAQFQELGATVVLSSPETLKKCFDKWEFYLETKSLDLPVPLTSDSFDNTLDFPYIMKPVRGRGSSGIHMIRDQRDVDYFSGKSSEVIFQQFISGPEYTVDTLSDMDGNFIYGSPRERIATDSGISTVGRTVKDNMAMSMIEKLLNHLKVKGPANVQYIRPNKDELYFIEINPRLSGGGALTEGAGIPFMSDVIEIAQGRTVPPRVAKEGVMMFREWSEVFINP